MPALFEARDSRLRDLLAKAPTAVFVTYAVVASFGTYFCMYAFRRPFAAARFEGELFADGVLEFKSALVISQVVGYALSKFIGIKVCSELPPRYHALVLLLLIGWAECALILLGAAPGDWKVAAIFLNGLSLGMVWGLVVRFLEGRLTSELLLVGLSSSFIVSSGFVKDVGRGLISGEVANGWRFVPFAGDAVADALGKVSEVWMPAVTGLHFLPLFFFFVFMLSRIPIRTQIDINQRQPRDSMDGRSRMDFLRAYLPGIVMLVVAYFLLTAYRDFRDNFSVEIFEALGYPYEGNETIITRVEILVAIGVLVILASLHFVRDRRAGLIATYGVMIVGMAMLAIATGLFVSGSIDGFWWMTWVGMGSYLAYVPYGSMLFERLMANTKMVGTAVFAIYLADAAGYTGAVAMMLSKDMLASEASHLEFFLVMTWVMAGVGVMGLLASCRYFLSNEKMRATRLGPGSNL